MYSYALWRPCDSQALSAFQENTAQRMKQMMRIERNRPLASDGTIWVQNRADTIPCSIRLPSRVLHPTKRIVRTSSRNTARLSDGNSIQIMKHDFCSPRFYVNVTLFLHVLKTDTSVWHHARFNDGHFLTNCSLWREALTKLNDCWIIICVFTAVLCFESLYLHCKVKMFGSFSFIIYAG